MSPEDVKGLAAQLVEAQQLETAAPDGLDPKVCNSKTHHKEWVAYDRKLTTQKALKLHPNLVEQFKDPSKKKQLFVDFYRVKGNLESLQLLVNVMVEMRQEAKLKYKKNDRAGLLDKFHNDESYVDLVIQDAIRHKRFVKDRLDNNKMWYWGVDEESLTLTRAKAMQVQTTQSFDLDADTAASMFSDGGLMDMSSVLDMRGADNKMLADFDAAAQPTTTTGGRGRGKGGTPTPAPKTPTPAPKPAATAGATPTKAVAPGATPGATVMLKTDPVMRAKSLQSKMETARGEAEKHALQLTGVHPVLANKCSKISSCIATAHQKLVEFLSTPEARQLLDGTKKSGDGAELAFRPLEQHCSRLLEIHSENTMFAKANISVQRRRLNPPAAKSGVKAPPVTHI